MKKYLQNFISCGILGWCLEIVFTAFDSFRKKRYCLKGNTSIWMFPIYGCACFLKPFTRLLRGKPVLLRGLFYAVLIFIGEYITGSILKKRALCPWDYSKSKWNINKIIRIDYLPVWFFTGLLFERLLKESDHSKRK